MKNSLKIALVLLCFVALALVRMFQTELFYDPFIEFFKGSYSNSLPPEVNQSKLFFHTFLRFTINTIISLLAIWVAFQKKSVIKFAIAFYTFALVILMSIKIILIQQLSPEWYSTFFYVRRFLIQPLFLIILLPAFYYQNIVQKK